MRQTFHSHQELQAAGHIWRGTGHCRACGGEVLWYENPNQRLAPIDPKTYALHFVTCAARKVAAAAAKQMIEFPSGGHRQASLLFDLQGIESPR